MSYYNLCGIGSQHSNKKKQKQNKSVQAALTIY